MSLILPEAEPADPAEEIEPFDWNDLEIRYHVAMEKSLGVENELAEEWRSLMSVSSVLV
jgi:hypothetical protein